MGKTILGFCYLYFFLHWGTGILMFRAKLGFSYESVTRYYLGDPEMSMNPRSFAGLLEVTHFHLFAMELFFFVLALSLLADMAFRLPDPLRSRRIRLAQARLLPPAAGGIVRPLRRPAEKIKKGTAMRSLFLSSGSRFKVLGSRF